MALTPSSALGVNSQRIAALVKTVDQTANALPAAIQTGGMKTAMAIKSQWYSIAAANGLPRDGKVARRKWRISDSTYGKRKESMTLIVSYDGPVHLVFGPTKRHIIVARRLTTRTGAKKRQARIGAMAAFGGSNRGVFGAMRPKVVDTRVFEATRGGGMVVSGGKLTVNSGKQALTVPSGSSTLRAYAFHPGTAGKDAVWPESKRAAIAIGNRTFNAETNKALVTNFGRGMLGTASAITGGTL